MEGHPVAGRASASPQLRPVAWLAAILAAAGLVAVPWLWQACVPAGWIGIAVWLVLVAGRQGWRAEASVLAGSVVAIGLAFHWTPEALGDAMRSSTLVGFVFAIPIILWDACRLALPFWAAGRLASDPRTAWLSAAIVAVVVERLMPAVFPWKFAYSQLAWPVVAQSAAVVGPEGPTFVFFAIVGTIIAGVSLVTGRPAGRMPAIAVAAIGITIANLVFGVIAIRMVDARMAASPTIRMALVQADPDEDRGIDTLRRLTREACGKGTPIDLVVWPECSGGSYEEGLDSFSDEAAVARRSREPNRGLRPWAEPTCPLLLGGRIYRGFRERPLEIFQSAMLIDVDERLAGVYHKRHLMPFGEYVPWADVVPELRVYFPVETPYDRGTEATVILSGQARIGTLLCYEDMVPSAAASLVREQANVLVALIHAAAFTNPLTLRQHRLLSQSRSIENRRMLVRCGSTGETCVIDAAGRIRGSLPLGTEGVLVADVPLLKGQTLANRLGPAFPIACGLALVALMVGKLRSQR